MQIPRKLKLCCELTAAETFQFQSSFLVVSLGSKPARHLDLADSSLHATLIQLSAWSHQGVDATNAEPINRSDESIGIAP